MWGFLIFVLLQIRFSGKQIPRRKLQCRAVINFKVLLGPALVEVKGQNGVWQRKLDSDGPAELFPVGVRGPDLYTPPFCIIQQLNVDSQEGDMTLGKAALCN